MAERAQQLSPFDPKIVRRALWEALLKLNPRTLRRNPVMFVVEVVAAVTTLLFLRDLLTGTGSQAFAGHISVWLWFTVLFANVAEAMAEGRGKAQADTLRRTKTETTAKRLQRAEAREYEVVPATSLRQGDVVLVEAGDIIPGDGDVIEGIASVDESAITGESAPVIRESGGDRSAVTGGTRVLSDWIKVKITSNPGETFLDRMIALVEGAQRQKTPNETALTILLVGLTIVFFWRPRPWSSSPSMPAGRCRWSSSSRSSSPLSPPPSAGCCRPSASPAWTAWCAPTSWPCPGAPSRPLATSIRCCPTRRARSR
jgi:K+-transporting ATPase ATPase B chain